MQCKATEVNDFYYCNCISLSVGWVPRHLNERASLFSRCKDCDDWVEAKRVFNKSKNEEYFLQTGLHQIVTINVSDLTLSGAFLTQRTCITSELG